MSGAKESFSLLCLPLFPLPELSSLPPPSPDISLLAPPLSSLRSHLSSSPAAPSSIYSPRPALPPKRTAVSPRTKECARLDPHAPTSPASVLRHTTELAAPVPAPSRASPPCHEDPRRGHEASSAILLKPREPSRSREGVPHRRCELRLLCDTPPPPSARSDHAACSSSPTPAGCRSTPKQLAKQRANPQPPSPSLSLSLRSTHASEIVTDAASSPSPAGSPCGHDPWDGEVGGGERDGYDGLHGLDRHGDPEEEPCA
ncbi:hypothetical protein BRADI_4g11456v3 [Brachypodium distachyon]|uniref:Uncharacterized protein n=1 Tax=Brachypodium distachyon TaxID=15368 RepID=A0A2K2CM44_BRADI|nr:hypothetical protein BRADI_4g11456v3 [Brachypodium distachyon]